MNTNQLEQTMNCDPPVVNGLMYRVLKRSHFPVIIDIEDWPSPRIAYNTNLRAVKRTLNDARIEISKGEDKIFTRLLMAFCSLRSDTLSPAYVNSLRTEIVSKNMSADFLFVGSVVANRMLEDSKFQSFLSEEPDGSPYHFGQLLGMDMYSDIQCEPKDQVLDPQCLIALNRGCGSFYFTESVTKKMSDVAIDQYFEIKLTPKAFCVGRVE